MKDFKHKIFNDPVHGFITVSDKLVFDIIEHPYFQRLRRIKQLGFNDFVYPGAIHTRFHHALGAYHLMLGALKILRIKGVKITDEEVQGACIAILLHDIGHGPFSHTLEFNLLKGVHHEEISKAYMSELNKQFKGKLNIAIAIFEGTYKKQFLHQLVSSQLDVDRLDYLTRDSFFTGVHEGVIAHNRIIEMLNVHNDELVIDEKGIYSIENFLIARRMMYWQVYLHKTVLGVEKLLISAINRAKFLLAQNQPVYAPAPLLWFLKNAVSLDDLKKSAIVLHTHSHIDDHDIMSALKNWRDHDDKILSLLASFILDRKLLKVEMSNKSYAKEAVQAKRENTAKALGISMEDTSYFVFTDKTSNRLYNTSKEHINILSKHGELSDVAKASDHFKELGLTEPVTKHFVCYPKNRA